MKATRSTSLISLFFLSSVSLSNAGAVLKRGLTPPATLPGAWAYQGCYTDVGRTINDAGYVDDVAMTDESCISFCASKGFQYAGTEYAQECYCGSSLAPAAAKVAETDCSTPCKGNASEPCGNGGRLSLFYSSQPVGPQANPGVNDFSYVGCYSEPNGARALSFGVGSVPSANMTVAKCTAACFSAGYILAGVEYSGECYCDNTLNKLSVASDGCNMLCYGNTSEICGGPGRLNLYDYKMQYPISLSSSTAPPTSTSTPAGSVSSTRSTLTTTTSSTISTSTVSTSTKVSSTSSASTVKTTSTTISTTSKVSSSTSLSSSTKVSSTVSTSTAKTTTVSSSTKATTSSTLLSSSTKPSTTSTVPPSSSTKASTTTVISSSSTKASTTTVISSSTKVSTTTVSPSASTSSLSTSTKPTTSSSSSLSTSSTLSTVSTKPTTSSSSSVSTSSIGTTTSITTLTTSTSTTTSKPVSTSSSSVLTSSSSSTPPAVTTTSTTIQAPVSTTTTTSAQPTGPTQPATVNGYTWYGCQTEATGLRALSGATTASDTMTLEVCQAFCSAYKYFGVEYGRECYCGDTFNTGSNPAAATDCSFLCPGNAFEYCGAGDRLSAYSRDGSKPSVSSSSSTTPTQSASGVSSSTPAQTGVPAGWTYQGCWIDGVNGRILDNGVPDSQTLTTEGCAQTCFQAGYTISGTEWAQQCFCGNNIVNGGVKTVDTDCNTPCTGNSKEMCGAGGRMSIISKGVPTVKLPPAPQTGGLNGSWTYQGCALDNVDGSRTFSYQLFFPGIMTPGMCLDRCAAYGYHAAGLEYGEECYCGDPANMATHGSTFVPDSQCTDPCAGNASAICGTGGKLTTYFWTGAPLYSWDFPTDSRAGRFELLLNGVNVPLMTAQNVNGKVTFVSKGGTGPGNETGSYELDLTLTSDINQAWRPMHVQTDVFCNAGLVLPDVAGRQISIGGWSGESTYGVRLYWPDGKPGTWGTHDWQENWEEVSLQAGRWYPSVMQMANGSIVVIGGEDGSNGAEIPSLEILPPTGTKPVYMDWLDRTHPNNLYPFAAVLPSKGIFVAYYNEARILDEKTFDTIKTLPMIPGAVNADDGGRTYPLEGTAVLLPQKYPYTDNLEVLICGGSTPNQPYGEAIDNCVSTKPDDASPKWIIERMPSGRVMPCMAPLPDGTYLITNGASAGVAGFGLAPKPNKETLLYDPRKAYGSRFTVMSNSTIARLYHSEAITLLDGRVLVSGSDPEDNTNPEEYRVEVFYPPYLLNGKARPTFNIANKDWAYGATKIPFTLGNAARYGSITVTLLGAVSSTHGNSMGARTLMPNVQCTGTSCTVDAPPSAYVAPPGFYQFFVLDGDTPAVAVYVRIGGDPAGLGNWPVFDDFSRPGVGTYQGVL